MPWPYVLQVGRPGVAWRDRAGVPPEAASDTYQIPLRIRCSIYPRIPVGREISGDADTDIARDIPADIR